MAKATIMGAIGFICIALSCSFGVYFAGVKGLLIVLMGIIGTVIIVLGVSAEAETKLLQGRKES